jgi:molybdopterin converting factor small subunit
VKVRARFFAQLRDAAGISEVDVDLAERSTIAALLERIYETHPGLRAHDQSMLFGIGVEFVRRNHTLQDGDEVAIMPPVQGG